MTAYSAQTQERKQGYTQEKELADVFPDVLISLAFTAA
jgi:hypothetical protein